MCCVTVFLDKKTSFEVTVLSKYVIIYIRGNQNHRSETQKTWQWTVEEQLSTKTVPN